jgi:prepilin-type N-terminal cleavage/methylation domain-containing protein
MYKNKINVIQRKIKAFSLIEIIVSLAIFSFIFSIVIGVSLSIVKAQSKVQSQIFLTHTAQIVLDSMSRDLAYGYVYQGTTPLNYSDNILILNNRISEGVPNCTIEPDVNGILVRNCSNSTNAIDTQSIYSNIENSPFILFESQRGDPLSYSDQKAYCNFNNQLYKINSFDTVLSNGQGYQARCDTGSSLLPDDIKLDFISFDIFGDSATRPKNPIVRIKLKLSDKFGESVYMQTTVTQRLVQTL